MKNILRAFVATLLFLSFSLFFVSCDFFRTELKLKYAIGDTGPAGGIIFFDKGEYNNHSVSYNGNNDDYSIDEGSDVGFSWRYMEIAPYGWYNGGEDPGMPWGGYGIPIGGTLQSIGTGKANTDKIISVLGEDTYAVKACAEYSVTVDGVTYEDWFMPSWYTLQPIWWNLISDQSSSNSGRGARRSDALGGFASVSYWSSSESGENNIHFRAYNARYQNFLDGYRSYFNDKIDPFGVRPVRAF